MKKLKCAVIGTGYLGSSMLKNMLHCLIVNWLPLLILTRLAAKAVADKHGAKALTDYQSLLGKVDAVSIVVPTTLHHLVPKTFLRPALMFWLKSQLR